MLLLSHGGRRFCIPSLVHTLPSISGVTDAAASKMRRFNMLKSVGKVVTYTKFLTRLAKKNRMVI